MKLIQYHFKNLGKDLQTQTEHLTGSQIAWSQREIHEEAAKKAAQELNAEGFRIYDLTHHKNIEEAKDFIKNDRTLKIIAHRPDKIAVNDTQGFEYEIKKKFDYYRGNQSFRTFIDLCTMNSCYGEFIVGADIWFCWYNERLDLSWSEFECVFDNVIDVNIPPRWDSDISHKNWYRSISEKLFPGKHIYSKKTNGSNDPCVGINTKNLKCISTIEMITTYQRNNHESHLP